MKISLLIASDMTGVVDWLIVVGSYIVILPLSFLALLVSIFGKDKKGARRAAYISVVS